MKLELLIHALAQLLSAMRGEEEHPSDMYLPEKLLSISLVFCAASAIAFVIGLTKGSSWYLGAAAALALGVSAFLCWRNQKIDILNDEEFSYTTMFGKRILYRFDDIVALRKNKDSYTLVLKTGKVHIESMAVLSERLIKKINVLFR